LSYALKGKLPAGLCLIIIGTEGLLQDTQRGMFEIVMAEALDRISRDQADVATLFKHMRFAGVPIVTLAEGEISELSRWLEENDECPFPEGPRHEDPSRPAWPCGEGQRHGGLCYGYRVVNKLDASGEPIRGDREIVPEEAGIVRRIFPSLPPARAPRLSPLT
jgi:hypothetical protein